MTARRVRSTLRAPLHAAGFVAEGTAFVHRMAELQHRIDVMAVRRMAGYVEIQHHVTLADEPQPWLTETLASHRLGSPYPSLWAAAALDTGLVLEQALAIRDMFRTVQDLAHFQSDRPNLAPPVVPGLAAPSGSPSTLSEAETLQALDRLGREILGPGFRPAPRTEWFELWIGQAEVGGFRHGAYMEANTSCTLATVVLFALPSAVFARGFHHDDARHQLWRARKQVFFDAGRPLLLPLRRGASIDTAAIAAALASHLGRCPPNRLEDPDTLRADGGPDRARPSD